MRFRGEKNTYLGKRTCQVCGNLAGDRDESCRSANSTVHKAPLVIANPNGTAL